MDVGIFGTYLVMRKKCLEGKEAKNAFHNEVKRIATFSTNTVMRYC